MPASAIQGKLRRSFPSELDWNRKMEPFGVFAERLLRAGIMAGRDSVMEELHSITVSDERLEDCRDVVEPDLQDLISATIASGFTAEEVLIAISELVAEDFAAAVNMPSVH
jgi:hypothetical protein